MSEQYKIQNKMVGAFKWSFLGEGAAKLITPFTNMILARILEPQHFGVLSIVVMITNFADLFTDAGFQKYLIQHFFKTDDELHEYASVAFWTNMGLTTFIWIIIFLVAEPLAIALDKPGYQWVIRVGSMKLFLTAFTSVQRAIYQRMFDYKTLSWVRIVVATIPILITIPMALMGFLYWSLIIGSLSSEFVYAVILTAKSKWKPKLYYSFEKLKRMFSFSIWTLVEQFTIWLSSYTSTLILSIYLTDYLVGMYTQPEAMVSAVFTMFSTSIFGILFSALSRLNDTKDEKGFWNIVLKTQLIVAIIIFPLSLGIFLYRDIATLIMFGEQWGEAAIVVGAIALATGIQVVLNNTASEVYRAKGDPKVSVLAQIIYIMIAIPLSIVSISQGFSTFVITRAGMSIIFMVIHYSIIKFRYKVSVLEVILNLKYPMLATMTMCVVVLMFRLVIGDNLTLDLLGMPLGALTYIMVICCFKSTRRIIFTVIERLSQTGKIGLVFRKIGSILKINMLE